MLGSPTFIYRHFSHFYSH